MWKFTPIYKETLWGGNRIASLKGICSASPRIGESWELSALPGSETIVCGGPDSGKSLRELCREHGDRLLGKDGFNRYGENFPLLVKLIDATADLSVQVHPDDASARRRGYPNGKNEMWYILGTTPGARIADGFRLPVTPDEFGSLVESGEISERLNFVEVSPGEAYFVPAGSVHALGAGTMVIEIQQASDTTYRIYDYGRRDSNGNLRPLHTELAKEVLDFGRRGGEQIVFTEEEGHLNPILSSPHFDVGLLCGNRTVKRDYSKLDSFVILVGISGCVSVSEYDGEDQILRPGETLLVGAASSGLMIHPEGDFRILEVSDGLPDSVEIESSFGC